MTDQFLDYMRYELHRSPLTVQKYEETLRHFGAYLKTQEEDMSWSLADADHVRGWMEQLMDGGAKPATVNTHLSALRSFYRFARMKGYTGQNPVSRINGPKKEKPLPQFVKAADMDRLIDNKTWGQDFKSLRARTLLILLYATGMRRAELTGLNDADIDFATRQLKVTGKRNKQRIIPFGEEVAQTMQQYRTERDRNALRQTDAFFVSDKGLRMTGAQVYNIVRTELSAITTMKKRSPHVLRHSFATAMLNNGASIESVRRLLGHESLSTTEIYTHTTFEQLRQVYAEAHPRG